MEREGRGRAEGDQHIAKPTINQNAHPSSDWSLGPGLGVMVVGGGGGVVGLYGCDFGGWR